MAYSDFSLQTVSERFALALDETKDLFPTVAEVTASEWLRDFVAEWAPIALAMNTEKARSEMIIAPILIEAVRLTQHRVSLFSGITFDVDKSRGLGGVCDFLLARTQHRYFVSRPILAIVEAKNEDLVPGLGQCAAAMVAAREFNQREGNNFPAVHGAVTIGSNWRFLRLQGDTLFVDVTEYYLPQLNKILGILLSLLT
jgi:hypothetical protein